jgi:hypothetical protein
MTLADWRYQSIDWQLADAVRQRVGLGCKNHSLLSEAALSRGFLIPRCLFSRPPIVEISALLRQWRSCLFNYLRVAHELPFKERRFVMATRARC